MADPAASTAPLLLVDGYNVIKSVPRFRTQESISLEAARAALERALQSHADRTLSYVTLVYDGDSGGPGPGLSRGGRRLEVVFSRFPHKADDVIRQQIQERHGARYLRVITSDGEIRRFARRHKVHSTPAVEFAEEMERPPRPSPTPESVPLEFDPDPPVDEQEVETWERLFRRDREE